MFIRSQNKEDLIKADNISVCEMNDSPKDSCTFEVVCHRAYTHYVLGEYSTKEKAIEVLDMIQKAYLSANHYYDNSSSVLNTVFQMPQDNEVQR